MRPEGLYKRLAEGLSSGRFPRTPHVVGILEKRPAIGVRDRITHGFPRRQYVATNLIHVMWGYNIFSRKLQAIVHRNGADATVRLDKGRQLRNSSSLMDGTWEADGG